jgi:hypothetical protein
MNIWSTDMSRLQQNPDAYEKFVLEQMINFGLGGKKLSLRELKKHWSSLDIDPNKRAYLSKLLWPRS